MIEDYAVYQIIFFAISIALIGRTIYLNLRGKKTFREVLVAVLFWGAFALLGLFPNLLQYLADITGFTLGVNALLIISVLILFYAEARQILYNDKLEHSITQLVRREALKELEERDNIKR